MLHQINKLEPQKAWTLVIDETGNFPKNESKKILEGRWVGVLIPSHISLAPNRKHYNNEPAPVVFKDLEQLFSYNDIGVFGLSISSVARYSSEKWFSGISELINWVLRLLPVHSEKTKLNIYIEQRSQYTSGLNMEGYKNEIQRSLYLFDVERAEIIEIESINICQKLKSENKVSHPWLSYADLVAYTWGSPKKIYRKKLLEKNLIGSCLIEGGRSILKETWDIMHQKGNLHHRQWSKLLSEPSSDDPKSIEFSILDKFAKKVKANPKLWEGCLDGFYQHLNSKAINILELAKQALWLADTIPKNGELSPELKLLWLTAEMAQESHAGEFDNIELDEELRALCNQLLQENARLVCEATLYRSVFLTNAYRFKMAEKVILPWTKLSSPEISLGLSLLGKVWSSLGQHSAFMGKSDLAIKRFNKALGLFNKLSYPRHAIKDIEQTRCYKAIALMESKDLDIEQVDKTLEEQLGDLTESCHTLAIKNKDGEKYKHYLLVRYIFECSKTDLAYEYLKEIDRWKVGLSDPWPSILMYRALILKYYSDKKIDNRQEKIDALIQKAYEISCESFFGPNIEFMGFVIRTVGIFLGKPWAEGLSKIQTFLEKYPIYKPYTENLIKYLLGNEEVTVEMVLKQSLPFNFR